MASQFQDNEFILSYQWIVSQMYSFLRATLIREKYV